MMGPDHERADMTTPSSGALPAERATTDLPLTAAMAASITAHGGASWRAAQLIGGALLAGGLVLGLFNLVAVPLGLAVRATFFLIGCLPCAALAAGILLVGRRYRRDAARDVAAGACVVEIGPVHVARTRTAAGILTRTHVHALFQPYPGIVTVVNGDVPAGVYPRAGVAYSRYGHYVFELADAYGHTLYRAPGLSASPRVLPFPLPAPGVTLGGYVSAPSTGPTPGFSAGRQPETERSC
jgi:hypothetical protein